MQNISLSLVNYKAVHLVRVHSVPQESDSRTIFREPSASWIIEYCITEWIIIQWARAIFAEGLP